MGRQWAPNPLLLPIFPAFHPISPIALSRHPSIPLLRAFNALHVRADLVDRLDPLGVRIAVVHDPAARLEIRHAVLDDHGPQRDARVHRTLAQHRLAAVILLHGVVAPVTNRTGVHAALLALQPGHELHGAHFGRAADGAGGEDAFEGVEAGFAGAQLARDLAHQVLHVAEAVHRHLEVDTRRRGAAHAVHVVARQVHQHHVLGVLLGVARQRRGQRRVLGRALAAPRRAGDRVRHDAPGVRAGGGRAHEQLRRCAHDGELGQRDVKEVGRGIDGAQVPVEVERVQCRGSCEALRGHGLDDVAALDVHFQRPHVRFVAGAADIGYVGGGFCGDGWLWRKGCLWGEEGVNKRVDGFGVAGVRSRQVGRRSLGRSIERRPR